MKIKCVSFSKYKLDLKSYVFVKEDLFEFLFTQIILKDNLDKNMKFTKCLEELDIKEDLFYLFNNVFYKFKDNHVINCIKEDISDVYLKDIVVNDLFIEPLSRALFPFYKGEVSKEFNYNYLEKKIVSEKDNYSDSNVMCFKVNNTYKEVEGLINKYSSALFNDSEGSYLLDEMAVDPYYFEIELVEENNKYVYKRSNKEELYDNLVYNSLFISDSSMDGEYLSSNIYFPYLLADTRMKDNCKYLFINDSGREFEVEDNIIYVNFDTSYDFIDLVNKEGYITGKCELENNEYISTYKKKKENSISEFKLYLIKNKDKFKININEVIEAI